MKKNLLRLGTLTSLLVASLTATAIDPPQVPAQELQEGEKYVLLNKVVTPPAMYRTNWDGAFFFGPIDGSGNAVEGTTYLDNQLEAVKNTDGTWSFTMTTPAEEEGVEPTVTYLAITTNTGNINMTENYASWIVEEGKYDNFYMLSPGEGSMEGATGYYLHLNKGRDYIIISYLGSQFYPDYEVKTEIDPEGSSYPVFDERGVDGLQERHV